MGKIEVPPTEILSERKDSIFTSYSDILLATLAMERQGRLLREDGEHSVEIKQPNDKVWPWYDFIGSVFGSDLHGHNSNHMIALVYLPFENLENLASVIGNHILQSKQVPIQADAPRDSINPGFYNSSPWETPMFRYGLTKSEERDKVGVLTIYDAAKELYNILKHPEFEEVFGAIKSRISRFGEEMKRQKQEGIRKIATSSETEVLEVLTRLNK